MIETNAYVSVMCCHNFVNLRKMARKEKRGQMEKRWEYI